VEVSDMPAILLDCDGVLVDNLAFERRVTQTIIETYAKSARLSTLEAADKWRLELSETKGHPSWYDYAFHCNRLGLEGNKVSERAHREAASLLTLVHGAEDTYRLLQEYGIQVGVVTDATRWVVNFKLSELGLNSISFVFSSNDAAATKASSAYWEKLVEQFEHFSPRALVDNRQINLFSASVRLPSLSLVQFDMEEHVMTLPSSVAPKSNGSSERSVKVVHNHKELQAWVIRNLV
jgi:FMN phosphatase YigB (HAD superfamily)